MSFRCASLYLIASVSLLFAYISAPLPGKLQPLSGGTSNLSHVSCQAHIAGSTGNTVAVVLNWSRFENVRRIASVLCKPELGPIIEQVLVWNNNPKPLTFLDFLPTACSEEKLRIVNSAENMYFHARFLGCSQSNADRASTPHERLSSESFAWLGHGTMMHHSLASEFLSLLQILNLSNEEVKMADNYFTVLRNHPPETCSGQRDNAEGSLAPIQGLAACLGRPCLFETTISLLSAGIEYSCERAQDMLDVDERNLRLLGGKMAHYSYYPPSFAVDGKPDTAFRSPRSATRGDTIALDMLCDVTAVYAHTQVVLLVDEATVRILRTWTFQTSPDGREWVSYY
ncbi:hypothetical protein V8E53_009043 [Lactarius tabidus]